MGLQIVWFKKDLRVHDHAALHAACASGEVLALYCAEPDIISQPDFSLGHWQFTYECLTELQHDLQQLGIPILFVYSDPTEALRHIQKTVSIESIHSHEETGNNATFQRDIRVQAWCQAHNVQWVEYPQNGVIRRLSNRDKWLGLREIRLHSDRLEKPKHVTPLSIDQQAKIIKQTTLAIVHHSVLQQLAGQTDFAHRQIGGRRAAVATLMDFLDHRATQYRGGISSPLKASSACSRLSPYLSIGNLSIREVVQASERYPLRLNHPKLNDSLNRFESRLYWHCHFIQKLETEPEIEFKAMHAGLEGMRAAEWNESHFQVWQRGETGYPLVDACTQMLKTTGWLNFRMRAMLVSFASYHLWLDWKKPAHFLARQFLDYEPGIHYPQIQMQSGMTGINTLRIYNPIKQAEDHDPTGTFVRHWLPALRQVPDLFIFEPWKMPHAIQQACGVMIGRDYPAPIVEHKAAIRFARDQISLWRKNCDWQNMKAAVMQKHGSRKRSNTAPKKRTAQSTNAIQADLFEEAS
ncbi:DNA photolyase family protein [Leeia sp. TBRC 13508]|uniref:DNA photolyase family protein n=1 Tax=Leeia speluncae TaxID=2884804 RepID=A0ABS8D9B2_9NEIS|nr:deoxyribodipyrimidine photo-lyase [Leeia speluncae]MCB6184707.1 DNA photolyase family protein [Leeia speluncae]